jgi:antitoxin component of MazEF toxin-antitoxin module
MQTHIGKWGASCAIRLPKMVVETLGLHPGEAVTLTIKDDSLVLHKSRPKYNLAELVRQMKSKNMPESFDDAPMGEEIL